MRSVNKYFIIIFSVLLFY